MGAPETVPDSAADRLGGGLTGTVVGEQCEIPKSGESRKLQS